MATIKDVAKQAGVSFKTVSRVLNNDTAVRESTRAKVLTAIEALNYRPNIMARNLRSQRTHTIGFISDVIASTPYAGRIIEGAQELAWENNYLLLLVNTGGNLDMKKTAVNTLLNRQVDGIIYATMYHREVHPPENIREVPTVLLDCFVADLSLPSIVPNEELGGYSATQYLIQQGHRDIAFLCEKVSVPAKHGRFAGYLRALSEANIPFNDNLVLYGSSLQKGGYDLTLQLFNQNQSKQPTAIFCFNDRMAMGAYDALRKLNLAIPKDVAVIGYDDQDLIAADLYPSLTTMALPHYEMGIWAVSHLLDLIGAPHSISVTKNKPIQKLLECPLIIRDSA